MNDIDTRIYQALGKISNLFKSQKIDSFKRLKLTPLMADLIGYISSHPKESSTVSRLSEEFSVTKATLSDAVSTLEERGLLVKEEDTEDSRIKYLVLTEEGQKMAEEMLYYERLFYEAVAGIEDSSKEVVYNFLINILRHFRERGDIKVLKSCVNCQNFIREKYKKGRKRHFCKLLKLRLSDSDINIDCSSNIPLAGSLS